MHGAFSQGITPPVTFRNGDPLFRGSAWPLGRPRRHPGHNARGQRCAQRVCRVDSDSDPFGDAGTLPHSMQFALASVLPCGIGLLSSLYAASSCCVLPRVNPDGTGLEMSYHAFTADRPAHKCTTTQRSRCGNTGAEPRSSQRLEEPQFEPRRRPQPRVLDPAQTVAWGGTLPSRRRAIVGGLSGLSIGERMLCVQAEHSALGAPALHCPLLISLLAEWWGCGSCG